MDSVWADGEKDYAPGKQDQCDQHCHRGRAPVFDVRPGLELPYVDNTRTIVLGVGGDY